MIKLVACDFDGTIVRADNTISQANIEAIQLLQDHNIVFLPCTGRSYADMCSCLPAMCVVPSIILNGALYTDANGSQILSEEIAKNDVNVVLSILHELGLATSIFTNSEIFAYGDLTSFRECLQAYYTNLDIEENYAGPIIAISNVEELQKANVLKMETMHLDPTLRALCYQNLNKICGIALTTSLGYNIEITKKGIHKASMLKRVLKTLQIQEDEVLVFGDSKNDLELFMEFKHSVAVDNADPVIKATSRYHCASCEDDGFSTSIKHLLKNVS